MSNGANPATESVPQNAEASGWQDHAVAITVAAAAGALVLGTVLYFAGFFDSGDEPPIRVKNGSLELQLLTNNRKWKDQDDLKHWKISGGTRAADELDVSISVNTGASCTTQSMSGATLIVTYSNGTTITIKATDKRTYVTSSADLTVVGPKNRLLTYTGDGFIAKVVLDTKEMCTFADKTQLAELIILDY